MVQGFGLALKVVGATGTEANKSPWVAGVQSSEE